MWAKRIWQLIEHKRVTVKYGYAILSDFLGSKNQWLFDHNFVESLEPYFGKKNLLIGPTKSLKIINIFRYLELKIKKSINKEI